MKNISKTTLSKNPQVKVYQPYAIFVVEEDTLVVLVLLEMDPKRHQLLSQRILGLKNQRSLTTKDPKRFGYLNLLDFFFFFFWDQRRRNGSWTVVAPDI